MAGAHRKTVKKLPPPALNTQIAPTLDDPLQRVVEQMFINNATLQEVQDRLGLTPNDAKHRFRRVMVKFMRLADRMDEKWVRLETLKMLNGAISRKELVRKVFQDRLDEIEHARASGDKPRAFPFKEMAAIREEEKFIHKILTDHLKTLNNHQPGNDLNVIEEDSTPQGRANVIRSHMKGQMAVVQERIKDEKLQASLLMDLQKAVGVDDEPTLDMEEY